MKARAKFNSNVLLLGILVFIAALLIFISLPLVSYAQTGTLGQESPEIYCTYEQDGVAVDGNELTAGTYDVSFVLSGVQNLSVIEITATYDQEQVTVASAPSYLASDDVAGLDSMGYVLSDGNIVFGLVSTNEDCTSVAEDGQIIATVQMTFASDCDPDRDGYITVSENPNLTFLQVDYGDGYDDAYALVDQYTDYTGNLYIMGCDVTPPLINSYDVCGQILIATDVTGTNTTVGIVGITVTVEKDGTTIATAETDANGNYTLADIPVDTYTMTISGPTTIDRTVTLEVTDDKAVGSVITVDSVGIVICDYNRDTGINATDYAVFAVAYNGDYDVYCDFNGDNSVNATDYATFATLYGNTINYTDDIIL